ncbi:MAG: hypothetical protein ACFFCS_14960 [Candidatus Hodarchaeota archaeon]
MSAENKLGLAIIFHPFEEGAGNAENLLEKGLKFLQECDAIIINAPALVSDHSSARSAGIFFKEHGVKAILVFLATWSDDNLLLEMLAYHDVPVINWGFKSMNSGSLCGSHQFNMVLKELGKESYVLFEMTEETLACLNSILKVLKKPREDVPIHENARVKEFIDKLKRLKIGIIGARTQGMMEVAYDEFSIKEVLGPSVLSFSLDYFKEMVNGIDETSAKEGIKTFKSTYPEIKVSVDDQTLLKSISIQLALGKLIEKHELDGISIECYPRYMGKVCLGFSILAGSGVAVACSCEGDVHAAILMWLMSELSGSPTNDIDLLDVDLDENTITGSHCGSCGFQLAGDNTIELAPVRLAGNGCSVLFPGKPGHVVLANLVGRKGTYRACILEGEAVPVDLVFPGNPVRIRLSKPVGNFLEKVGDHGFGHHWIVAYSAPDDDNYGFLIELLTTLGIKVVS